MFAFFKTKIGMGLIGAVIVIIMIVMFVSGKKAVLNTITARTGTITETIGVTGSVTSSENVDLSFQRSGRLSWLNVVAGSRVRAGQVLMSLDSSELYAQQQLQLAQVAAVQAKLDKLLAGASNADIRVSQTTVENAKQSLIVVLQDGYTKADDAIRNKADQVFFHPNSDAQTKFSRPADQLSATRVLIGQTVLPQWQTLLGQINFSNDLTASVIQVQGYLGQIKTFLDSLSAIVNDPSTSYQSDYGTAWVVLPSSIKTDISSARANINTALSNLVSAQSSYKAAQDQLALKVDQPASQDIAIAKADVDQAKANLALVTAQINQNSIVSPIYGLVTAVNAKRGETMTAGAIAVSVLNDGIFQVDSNVPETDIGKIVVGDSVKITLDALPGENFAGKVITINPGKTIIDGVVNYKVTVLFTARDPRFKDGLTANLDIQTDQKIDAIILPQVAIFENDQGTYVRKVVGESIAQMPVKLGIRSRNGDVEIISGVSDGDIVENIGLKK